MKINYTLDVLGYIKSYSIIPFNINKPTLEVSEKELEAISTGKCKITNNMLDTSEVADFVKANDLMNKLRVELADLKSWFMHYDKEAIQYQRHLRLGIESNINMSALDQDAEIKAKRIKEIEILLGLK